MSIKIVRYTKELCREWDVFIDNSKNGTFMLKRNYMDYHSDKFTDFSLMIYETPCKLIAVLPASVHDNIIKSHGGLTYGGLVYGIKMTMQKMLDIFTELRNFLKSFKITELIYKRIPSVYYSYPCDEDLYALFRNNAKLIRVDISSVISLQERIKFSELRRRMIKKAKKNNIQIIRSYDYKTYIDLLTKVLKEHHGTKPVHTAEELSKLANNFPENIKLFAAYKDSEMVAGVVIFDTKETVHAQYIANSEKGRTIGALDLVIDFLINEYSKNKRYFDFGISTENNGMYLNNGLISQKESFGGRGIIYEFFSVEI